MRDDELPAGPALDAALQRVLLADAQVGGWDPDYTAQWCGRVKPWSTNIMLTMSLIDDVRYGWRASIALTCDAAQWTCLIEGTTREGDSWYCEASGHTLPEAFCRAWVQRQDDDADETEDEDGSIKSLDNGACS